MRWWWLQLCPLKLFYIVYNPQRLRHFVPDRASLSYITYRRLIRKHSRRRLKRLTCDGDKRESESVATESTVVSCEQRSLSCSVAADIAATVSISASSSSSVKDSAPVNSCTAVVSRSSFSIMRLLSLSDDEAKTGSDDGGVRKLSPSMSAVSQAPAETRAGQRETVSVDGAQVKPVPVHFKKRMLNTATTVSQSSTSVDLEPAIIGQSVTPLRRSFTIHQDPQPTTSTPPAKVGIVISHGRAMTLQDKLQMTTNAARLSPTSSADTTPKGLVCVPVAGRYKLKRRRLKTVVKRRSLIPTTRVR